MNTYYVAGIPYSCEQFHHGIKGQKWGIRRYQNEDGSLTSDGIARYNKLNKKIIANERLQQRRLKSKIRAEKKYNSRKYGIFGRYTDFGSPEVLLTLERKVNKRTIRYDKAVAKGNKLAQQLRREFGNIRIDDISRSIKGEE